MIITRTPYRLSFFGGGTDYNAWFEEHGGLVLAVGLAHYCYITTRYLPPFFEEHTSRIVYSKIESVFDHNKIQHPSVRGCLQFQNIDDGVEIHHDGDLPARSGTGSSSSFTVGLLHALNKLKHKSITPRQLALDAIHVEQNLLEESVGVQDQIMASYGGFRNIELGPGSTWKASSMDLSNDYLKALEEHVLLGFSGISRTAEKHAKKKIENIRKGRSIIPLQGITALTREAQQDFQKQADFEVIGKLLDKTWRFKQSLADGVSPGWMNDLYQTGMQNGAFGGKLMGAGGGGFFFFLAPPDKHQQIREALSQIKVWVPFKIDHRGSHAILS